MMPRRPSTGSSGSPTLGVSQNDLLYALQQGAELSHLPGSLVPLRPARRPGQAPWVVDEYA